MDRIQFLPSGSAFFLITAISTSLMLMEHENSNSLYFIFNLEFLWIFQTCNAVCLCKCRVIFKAVVCLAFSLSVKLQGLYSILRNGNYFLFIFAFLLFCTLVWEGKEQEGDLWVHCSHLVYYKDVPIRTDKPFPFSCPFSKYFSLLILISILSWREKNKKSYAYISSSLYLHKLLGFIVNPVIFSVKYIVIAIMMLIVRT